MSGNHNIFIANHVVDFIEVVDGFQKEAIKKPRNRRTFSYEWVSCPQYIFGFGFYIDKKISGRLGGANINQFDSISITHINFHGLVDGNHNIGSAVNAFLDSPVLPKKFDHELLDVVVILCEIVA